MPVLDEEWLAKSPSVEDAYVAFFDILGYREILQDQPLQRVVKEVLGLDSLSRFVTQHLQRNGFPEGLQKERLELVSVSDSILLFALDNHPMTLHNIVYASNAIMNRYAARGLLLRGAVTKGPLFVSKDRHHYLGRGLTRAYELEQRQAWGGAILDEALIGQNNEEQGVLKALEAKGELLSYPVPFKGETGVVKRQALALGWPLQAPDQLANFTSRIHRWLKPGGPGAAYQAATEEFIRASWTSPQGLNVKRMNDDLQAAMARHAGSSIPS